MSAAVDVLALVKAQAAHHLALSRADAFSAQEAPKWTEAALAIGELIEAARAVAGAHLTDVEIYDAQPRLRAAINNATGATP